MSRTRYFIRPGKPEAVKWTNCPEDAVQELKERGLTETDKDAYEILRRDQERDHE